VILEHDHPELHWDFMLETGAVLRTWRLNGPPAPAAAVPAVPSFDHRKMYLDYEGPISGGRGRVVRWDAGTFSWQRDDEGCVAVHLEGGRLQGTVVLQRQTAAEWELRYDPSCP
jgi:hypothetical protein